MKKKLLTGILASSFLFLGGCQSFVKGAVDTLAAAQGFIAQAQLNHMTECSKSPTKPFPCGAIDKAVVAQNAAIDALEAYCQVPVLPDAITLKASGSMACNANPSAKQVLVSALSNVGAVLSSYKQTSGGKP